MPENPRFNAMNPAELEYRLDLSRRGAEELVCREIKCPVCGFYLLDVYGREHNYTRVKCRKCKFNEVIDTALFRTAGKDINRYFGYKHKKTGGIIR